jgi:hypothetical protein
MVLRYFNKNRRQWHVDIPGYLDRHPDSDVDLYVDDDYSHKFFDFFVRNPIIQEQQYSGVEKQSMVRLETNEFDGYHVKLEKYGKGEFDSPISNSEQQYKGVCYKIVSTASDSSGRIHSHSYGFNKIWLCDALKELFNGQHPDMLYMRNLFNEDENTLNPIDRGKYLEFIRANTPTDKKDNSGCSTKSIIILLGAALLINFFKSCISN